MLPLHGYMQGSCSTIEAVGGMFKLSQVGCSVRASGTLQLYI